MVLASVEAVVQGRAGRGVCVGRRDAVVPLPPEVQMLRSRGGQKREGEREPGRMARIQPVT